MAPPKLTIGCSINKKDVLGLTLEEEASMRQWVEYRKVVIDRQPIAHNVLSELNTHLTTRSYLTGNQLTKADFEIQEGLYNFYVTRRSNFSICFIGTLSWGLLSKVPVARIPVTAK